MNLKDRALAVLKEQQEYEAEQEAARFLRCVKATETAFQKMFGEYLSVAPGTCDTVLAKDGLKFRAVFSLHHASSDAFSHFEIAGTCPDCGADCYSARIGCLISLGEQLENFEPGWPHKCPPAVCLLTVGDILLNALQDFIYELVEEA